MIVADWNTEAMSPPSLLCSSDLEVESESSEAVLCTAHVISYAHMHW